MKRALRSAALPLSGAICLSFALGCAAPEGMESPDADDPAAEQLALQGTPETAELEPRADGTFYFIRAKHSDKCLHQHGAVFDNGAKITQWDCIDQYNVEWELEESPDPDYYFIKARHSGKCVHQHGATYGNGDPITQWDCVNQGNVKWRIIPAPNNYYYVQVQHSAKCLHVHGGSWDNGAAITQWDCINQPNVLWWFDPVGH